MSDNDYTPTDFSKLYIPSEELVQQVLEAPPGVAGLPKTMFGYPILWVDRLPDDPEDADEPTVVG